MEEDLLLSFMESYNLFKDNLERDLNNKPKKIESELCYLIFNNWLDLVVFYYNSYINNKKYCSRNNKKLNFCFPKESPLFIQSIDDSLNYISKIAIINKNTMDILNYRDFKNKKLFKIYIGYKKIIIEDPDNLYYSLLVINPLDKINREGLIFKSNFEDRQKYYESYLIEEYNRNNNLKNKFYLDEKFQSYEYKILKFCIMLYYYEKYLLNEINFNNNEKYYLIKHNFLNKFKRVIKYQDIYNLLTLFDVKLKNEINYPNLDIDFFTKHFLNEYQDKFKKLEKINQNIIEYESPKLFYKQNIYYYSNCFIIDYKIMDLMKQIIFSVAIFDSANISINNKKIYLLLDNNINIGELNKELIFVCKYIFSYNSNINFNEQKKCFLNMDLNKYLSNNQQKKGALDLIINRKKIGTLHILNFNNYDSFKFKSIIINSKKIISDSCDTSNIICGSLKPNRKEKMNNRIFLLFFKKLYNFHVNFVKKNKIKELINILNIIYINKLNYKKQLEKRKNIEKQNEDLNKIQKDFDFKLNQFKSENENLKSKIEFLEKKEKENEEKEKYIEILKKENQQYSKNIQDLELEKNINNEKIVTLAKKEEENIRKIEEFKQKENNYINEIYEKEEKIKYLNSKINIKNISKNIKGLDDVGDINFMNSILQCFNQSENLVYYFLNESSQLKRLQKEEHELSQAFLEIIEELWRQDEKSVFTPYYIKNVIISKNKSFDKANIEIIGEFIKFFLDQLHKELKIKKEDLIENNLINNLNINNNNKSFSDFMKNFKKEKSIISELFFGYFEDLYKCPNCNDNIIYYNYEIFKFISFPLEEILETYNLRNNNDDNCKITINDCFDISFNNNIKEKNILCNNCKTEVKCKYESVIYQIPEILIIILKRDINDVIDIELDFDEIIDITKFVSNNNNNSKSIYELYGVITCKDKNQNCHFCSSCKNMIDNKWYRYDNTNIQYINNFEDEVIKYKIPYILFYKKIQNNLDNLI